MQPFDETKLSDIQRKEFESLPEQAKDLVCKGHLVKIISTETKEEICTFNENSFEIPKGALESFARAVLPDIIEYYKNKKDDIVE